jgi:hypothetical protein
VASKWEHYFYAFLYSMNFLSSIMRFSLDFLLAFSCDSLFFLLYSSIHFPPFFFLSIFSPLFLFLLLYFISLILLSLFISYLLFITISPPPLFASSFSSLVSAYPSSFAYFILSFLCTVIIFFYIRTYTFNYYNFSLRHIILLSTSKMLKRAIIGFVMPVNPPSPSDRMGQLAPTGRAFMVFYTGFSDQTV